MFLKDAPHGSAMFFNFFRMLRMGARFSSKFSRCWERDFPQNFQCAPHGSAMFFNCFRMLRTGARFFSKFSVRMGARFSSKQDDLEWSIFGIELGYDPSRKRSNFERRCRRILYQSYTGKLRQIPPSLAKRATSNDVHLVLDWYRNLRHHCL